MNKKKKKSNVEIRTWVENEISLKVHSHGTFTNAGLGYAAPSCFARFVEHAQTYDVVTWLIIVWHW